MAASKMDPLLEIKSLKTHFFTHEGTVQAVNGVSLTVGRGRITGVVGESGCGKSVMGRSILNIIESNGKIVEGSILYYSEPGRPPVELAKLHPRCSEIRRIRVREISMIFQEPMTSFSPVHTVGNDRGSHSPSRENKRGGPEAGRGDAWESGDPSAGRAD